MSLVRLERRNKVYLSLQILTFPRKPTTDFSNYWASRFRKSTIL